MSLLVKNLSVEIEQKLIIKNISIEIKSGEVCFLLGKNGAGKSTLAQSLIMPIDLHTIKGKVFLDDNEITNVKPEEKSKLGFFVSYQNPLELEGITLFSFLHTIYTEKFGNDDALSRSTFKFRKHVLNLMSNVGLNVELLDRSLNVGFSGGEKKRTELLQMLLLRPCIIILDEIDSGLDIHARQILKNSMQQMIDNGAGILVITHNIDFVLEYDNSSSYVLSNGEIVFSGNSHVAIDKFKNA